MIMAMLAEGICCCGNPAKIGSGRIEDKKVRTRRKRKDHRLAWSSMEEKRTKAYSP